ncbi:hypothetical protein HDU76_002905 [Blyttiomyces sp. JEL0837]|nr:hypothetical protein HDU76_002905 [Blyttiomyces sp. JEL0837]
MPTSAADLADPALWQFGAGVVAVAVAAGWSLWWGIGLVTSSVTKASAVPRVGEMIRRKSIATIDGTTGKDDSAAIPNSPSRASSVRRFSFLVVPDPPDGKEKPPLLVTEAMLDLSAALNDLHPTRRILRPSNLMSALAASNNSNRRLMCYDQQDAHELLQLVSSSITDEEIPRSPIVSSLFQLSTLRSESVTGNLETIKPPSSLPSSSSSAPISSTITAGTKRKQRHGKTGSVTVVTQDGIVVKPKIPPNMKNPLTGLLANTMTCMKCGYTSAPQITVEGLLQAYVTPEAIHEYVCDRCSLVATLKKVEADLAAKQKEVELLRESRPTERGKPRRSPDKGKGKEKEKAKKEDLTLVVQKWESEMKRAWAALVQLEKDRVFVDDAVRFNVEAKLPDHIKRVKIVSPLSKKQILIAAPPSCLCLHMQRSVYLPSGHVLKNNCRVLFRDLLDIGAFCTGGGGEMWGIGGGGLMRRVLGLAGGNATGALSGLDVAPPPLEEVSTGGEESMDEAWQVQQRRRRGGNATSSSNVSERTLAVTDGDLGDVQRAGNGDETSRTLAKDRGVTDGETVEEEAATSSGEMDDDVVIAEPAETMVESKADGLRRSPRHAAKAGKSMNVALGDDSLADGSSAVESPKVSAKQHEKDTNTTKPSAKNEKDTANLRKKPSMEPAALGPPPPYPYLYRLHAVVLHYGSHDSGHFVTYRRCPHPLSREAQKFTLDKPLEEDLVDDEDEEEEETVTDGSAVAATDVFATDSPAGSPAVTEAGLRRRKGKRSTKGAVGCDVTAGSTKSEASPATTTTTTIDPSTQPKNRKKKKRKMERGVGGTDGTDAEPPARWFRISDDRVDVVRDLEGEVYGHGAAYVYMLFYERVEDSRKLGWVR